MSKVNCNIIRDLFPSYLDKLTSKESNEVIETHLTDCADCNEILSALSQTLAVDTKEANRDIDYLKKIKSKRKAVLLYTILACVLVFSAITSIGIKHFVMGSPISSVNIDADKTDNYTGIGTKFNPETNELTIYGEILLNQAASKIKVEEAKGLAYAYNVTVYGASRIGTVQEHNRKFEKTIKIPDDNNIWSVYSIGKIPQDTILIWSNDGYFDEKSAPHFQKLMDLLTTYFGFIKGEYLLERHGFQDILSDPCYIFSVNRNIGNVENFTIFNYAVSEDCERVYYFDIEKEVWTELNEDSITGLNLE